MREVKIQYCPKISLFQITIDGEFIGLRNLQWLKDIDKKYYNSTANWAIAIENPNQEFTL